MLGTYFLQQWFNLSDHAVEESLHDSVALRSLVGSDLGRKPAADQRAILRFRHFLERNQLDAQLFDEIKRHFKLQDLNVATSAIVNATIVRAPSSTKNKTRDPQMHQTMKDNQWYFGTKAHIALDNRSELIYSVVASKDNLHDKCALRSRLHGRGKRIYGDSVRTGQTALIKINAHRHHDFTQRHGHDYTYLNTEVRCKNRNKFKIRTKVKRAFLNIKRIFKFDKHRYWGFAKSLHRSQVTCALTNAFMGDTTCCTERRKAKSHEYRKC